MPPFGKFFKLGMTENMIMIPKSNASDPSYMIEISESEFPACIHEIISASILIGGEDPTILSVVNGPETGTPIAGDIQLWDPRHIKLGGHFPGQGELFIYMHVIPKPEGFVYIPPT